MTWEQAKHLTNGDRIRITDRNLQGFGKEGTVTDARFHTTIYVIMDGEKNEGWLDPKSFEKINS